jgi:hypothetical protein
MIKKEIEGKELKQVLHFRFSFEPRFSEVDKSLFLPPPLRTTSCNVHYSGPILYDNERETWSKSTAMEEGGILKYTFYHVTACNYCSYIVCFLYKYDDNLTWSNWIKIADCFWWIETNSFKILKWNAGVRSFRRDFHLLPVLKYRKQNICLWWHSYPMYIFFSKKSVNSYTSW